MGLLASSLKAKLASRDAHIGVLMTLGAPFSKLYAPGGWAASNAFYEDRIQRISGTLARRMSDSASGRIPSSAFTVDIRDTDHTLSKIIEGASADDLYGASVGLYLAESSISTADYFQAFVGILTKWDPAGDRLWTLSCRTDDLALEREHGCPITQADFPGAKAEVWGKEAPRIYGRHESLGATNGGMVPTLPVDPAKKRYLICRGWAKSVPRVYVDAVLKTSGYTIDRPIVNGKLYTCVTFTDDQGSKPVTVDVHGYETVGDGSGSVIENPADQIIHILTNWVYGRHANGNWAATHSIIDTTLTAAATSYFTRKGFKGSPYIAEKATGHTFIERWLLTWRVRGFWTTAGKLAFVTDEHVLSDVYPATQYLEDSDDLKGSFRTPYQERLINRVPVRFKHSATLNDFTQTLVVRDPSVTRDAEEAIEMPWAYASAGA